jgi:penicillin-binding protein 1A
VWWGYDSPYDMTETLTKDQAKTRTCVLAWKELMERIQGDLEYKEFPIADGVVQRSYCTASGLLATSACPSTATGYYKSDDLPATCDYSHGVAITAESTIGADVDTD